MDVHQAEAIQEQLDRILKSAPFRQTRRCQDLLRFVVLRAASGNLEQPKERTLGVEVFGRPADYDTNQDPVVRGAAMELRKRLAQYYMAAADHELRIEIPPGSYAPEFHWPAQAAAPPIAPAQPPAPQPPTEHPSPGLPLSRRKLYLWSGIALLGCVSILLAWRLLPAHQLSVLDRFWAPVLTGPRPVLLCVGLEPTYEVSNHMRGILKSQPRTAPIEVGPDDVLSVPPRLVPLGDSVSLARLTALFARFNKSYQIRGVSGTSFADLRDFPTVLIGAYSNVWTTHLNSPLRFSFRHVDEPTGITDRLNPKVNWDLSPPPDWKVPHDFAIASRIFDQSSGNTVVTVAGLVHFGTQAAGELLTNEDFLARALESAPEDWPRKNLQIVLKTTVRGDTPGPPEVLAVHVW